MLLFLVEIIINIVDTSDYLLDIIGWTFIGLVLFSLIATWYFILPKAITKTLESLKSCFSQETSENNENNIEKNKNAEEGAKKSSTQVDNTPKPKAQNTN